MNIAIVIAKVLILVLLAVGMFFQIQAIREYEVLTKIREKVDELDRQRILEDTQKSFLQKYLDKLDETLVQAGVKRFLPKAGVELYFLFNVLEFTPTLFKEFTI